MKNLIRKIKAFVRDTLTVVYGAPAYRPARCTNIQVLLLHLCDFDQELATYVARWLAYPLRNPGARMQTALVINGPQGTGASLFFDEIASNVDGGRNLHQDNVLRSRFNDWALGARLAVVDGALFTKKATAQLKSLVSSSEIIVDRKGLPPSVVPNKCNFVFVTSSPDFLRPDLGDRRFVVIEAPPPRERLFYLAVGDEIRNGGVDAYLEYLMTTLDMGNFNEFSQPPSAASGAGRRKEAA